MTPRATPPAVSPKQPVAASGKARTKKQPKPVPETPAPPPRGRGRPRTGKFEAALPEILTRLSEGEELIHILPEKDRPAHLPSRGQFNRRMVDDDPKGLSVMYNRARQAWAYAKAEECLEISDAAEGDIVIEETDDGPKARYQGTHVQRSKLQIDTRLRLIGKFHPRQFGDRMDITSGDAPLRPGVIAMPELHRPEDAK
jgi:hypothetical protein